MQLRTAVPVGVTFDIVVTGAVAVPWRSGSVVA
jgi:hypothetical protein